MEDNIKKFEGFLDRMQGLLDNAKKQGHIIVRVEDLENAFPELKESEDERIRKSIIAIINNYVDNSNTFKPKMLAWLEKQGKEDSSIQQAYKHGYIEGQRIERKCWLEKQGQQKYIPKYKIGDYVKNTNYKGEPIYEIIYMDKECYICEYRGKERMGDKAVMHFSFDNPYLRLVQKPADIEQNFSNSEKVGKNDTLLDLLQKMPSYITVDGLDYHFVLKKIGVYIAYYECEGEEGRDKIIFWMAGDPVDLLTAMLEKLKEEGLLE